MFWHFVATWTAKRVNTALATVALTPHRENMQPGIESCVQAYVHAYDSRGVGRTVDSMQYATIAFLDHQLV